MLTFPCLVPLDHIFPRQNGCVSCPPSSELSCPACPTGQQCQFIYPTDCTQCPSSTCVAQPSATATPSSSAGPSVGAIAGGVVGGVAVIAVVTYLVWRFCVKSKRQPFESQPWDEEQDQAVDMEPEKRFTTLRDQRASTHTVHSIASTVLTRASNIIQIAYIPGVTNRATPTSPTLLVPPVPPIPIAVSQSNSPSATDDQHFFVPGDLRDSTYSALSGYSDRTSYARTSYAPRSSVASTIYGKNAIIVAPAQTGMRVKPGMVSVKSTSSAQSGGLTPPVPSVDYQKYNGLRPASPANSTFSVGSTFLNSASAATATPARAQVVRVGSGAKRIRVAKPSSTPEEPAVPASPTTPTTPVRVASPMVGDSNAPTLIDTADQGPFVDPPESPSHRSHQSHQSTHSLSAIIQEATRRASQKDATAPLNRDSSPFGDEHATRD